MIPTDNWNFREECLKYLKLDVLSLFKIISEFNRLIFIYFGAQVVDSLTITRLALNIFYNKYYEQKTIPYINQKHMFEFIQQSLYGGITEVYIPYGENLIYIDVNSLYPFAALNNFPGTECTWIESYNEEGLNLNEIYGFFYAKIKTKDDYIGLLPLHIKNNELISPNGEFEGVWTTSELKFAKENGYEIKVIKGYNFNETDSPFTNYIKDLYEKKKKFRRLFEIYL